MGVGAGFLGMLLGLGDHTEAILSFTRAVGVLVATGFMFRMLLATYRGSIHPIGGLGISTLVLVVFFPVVHPWYILWAVLPLAAWANRLIFRLTVVIYSAGMSFFVLPRALASRRARSLSSIFPQLLHTSWSWGCGLSYYVAQELVS